MKKILFFIAALSLTVPGFAQSDDGEEEFIPTKEKSNAFFLGLKAGGTMTSMTQPNEGKLYDGSDFGFSGGLVFQTRFGKEHRHEREKNHHRNGEERPASQAQHRPIFGGEGLSLHRRDRGGGDELYRGRQRGRKRGQRRRIRPRHRALRHRHGGEPGGKPLSRRLCGSGGEHPHRPLRPQHHQLQRPGPGRQHRGL